MNGFFSHWSKSARALFLLVPLLGFVSAALPAQGAETILRLRSRDDIISLDPAYLAKPSDHVVAFNIYDGLVRLKAGTAQIEPNLAHKWTLSPDGKTYTFHLRKGVKFHKGYGIVTARDFKYSFERIMDPKTKSRYRRLFAPLKNITVVDDYTLKLELKYPYPSFLTGVLAFRPGWVISRKAFEKMGKKKFSLNPIGSGPFMFNRWLRGSEIVLDRNKDYYEPVRIDRVIFKVIKKDSVARLALEKGDIDGSFFFDGATIKTIKEAKSNIDVHTLGTYRTHWLGINLRRKRFQDIRVRQAILYAINKKDIADHVFFGNAAAVNSLFNPNVPEYFKTEANFYNPEKAKQLLKEAGYPNGLDIDFLCLPTSAWPSIGAVLIEQWKKVGIRAKMKTPERSIYNRIRKKGNFDVVSVAISRVDPDQYAYSFLHGSNIPVPNYSGYKGANDIIEKARQAVDPEKRKELYKEFQVRIAHDLPGFAVVNVHYAAASKPYLKGLKPTFMDSYPVREMYIEKK